MLSIISGCDSFKAESEIQSEYKFRPDFNDFSLFDSYLAYT